MADQHCNSCKENQRFFRELCKDCFVRDVEKKAKAALTEHGRLPRNCVLVIREPESLAGKTAQHLLRAILKGFPATITLQQKKNEEIHEGNNSDWIVQPWLLEQELDARFTALLQGRAPVPQHAREIRLLKYISIDELKAFGELHALIGTLPEPSELVKALLPLEKRSPGALGTLARGLKAVQE